MCTMIKDERSSPTSSSRDICLQRIGDTLAEVRGLDGKLLGEWILDDDRSGPWRWVPMADAALRDLPLMDTLTAAATAVRVWFRENRDPGHA